MMDKTLRLSCFSRYSSASICFIFCLCGGLMGFMQPGEVPLLDVHTWKGSPKGSPTDRLCLSCATEKTGQTTTSKIQGGSLEGERRNHCLSPLNGCIMCTQTGYLHQRACLRGRENPINFRKRTADNDLQIGYSALDKWWRHGARSFLKVPPAETVDKMILG